MTALLSRLCRRTPRPLPLPLSITPPAAPDPLTPPADPAAPVAAAASPAEPGTCGWFDSSLDLRQGLAVSEVRDPDWTVLLLWFGPAALRASVRLQ